LTIIRPSIDLSFEAICCAYLSVNHLTLSGRVRPK
jgi:hypothetical protein